MKCKNCSAPITSRVCEYCGTEHKEYIEDKYITIPIDGKDIKFYKNTLRIDAMNPINGMRDIKGNMYKEKPKYIYTITLTSEPIEKLF